MAVIHAGIRRTFIDVDLTVRTLKGKDDYLNNQSKKDVKKNFHFNQNLRQLLEIKIVYLSFTKGSMLSVFL